MTEKSYHDPPGYPGDRHTDVQWSDLLDRLNAIIKLQVRTNKKGRNQTKNHHHSNEWLGFVVRFFHVPKDTGTQRIQSLFNQALIYPCSEQAASWQRTIFFHALPVIRVGIVWGYLEDHPGFFSRCLPLEEEQGMYVFMYDSGRPCGDVHGTISWLGQGERSLKTCFPNPAGKSLRHSCQDVLTLMCFLPQLCCWRLRVSWRPIYRVVRVTPGLFA